MGWGMTGFTPKRNLVNESTALCRDFPCFARSSRQGWAVQASPPPQEGFCGAAHFTPRPLGVPGWTRTSGHTVGIPGQQSLAPRSQAGKDGGCEAASAPFSAAPTERLH